LATSAHFARRFHPNIAVLAKLLENFTRIMT